MSDLKPPCDCIEKLGGCWRVVDCQCGNKDDYGDARAWCAEHNRPASVPLSELPALADEFGRTFDDMVEGGAAYLWSMEFSEWLAKCYRTEQEHQS